VGSQSESLGSRCYHSSGSWGSKSSVKSFQNSHGDEFVNFVKPIKVSRSS
jgi:hypothetical protein